MSRSTCPGCDALPGENATTCPQCAHALAFTEFAPDGAAESVPERIARENLERRNKLKIVVAAAFGAGLGAALVANFTGRPPGLALIGGLVGSFVGIFLGGFLGGVMGSVRGGANIATLAIQSNPYLQSANPHRAAQAIMLIALAGVILGAGLGATGAGLGPVLPGKETSLLYLSYLGALAGGVPPFVVGHLLLRSRGKAG
ncbi:MAG: hypothetical protein AB7K24_20815 [Gemmataceae bacterium]